jgi:DNA helicase-2/ATP-dependent DNA helicase PcrA
MVLSNRSQPDLFDERSQEEQILDGLNPQQREAVTHDGGPLLIVAGAGTGKTKVITHRIAYLIATKRARPEEILALTFTEKAAAEMEERVDLLVPYGFATVNISTFHSFGDRLLRDYALELGLDPDFQVLGKAEQFIFFRQHLFEFPLRRFRPLGNPTRFIFHILGLFSRAKDEDVSPDDYLAFARELTTSAEANSAGDLPPKQGSQQNDLLEEAQKQLELAETYAAYQRLLAENGKVDFGDQIVLPLRLLRERPRVLQEVQKRFKYILVDEFQDTNYAQFELVKLLASGHRNLTVVADDDQSIYKFRGAAISNILNFRQSYPDARLVVLTRNYRSSQAILDASYKLIRHNDPDRLEVREKIDKRLRAVDESGPPPVHLHYDTLSSEAEGVVDLIKQKVAEGSYRYSDFAILVRANNSADPFLNALHRANIPSTFTGNRGLYNRPEVRLLLAFVRALSNLSDSISLYFLAASELYEFPMEDLTRLMSDATNSNRSLYEVFKKAAASSDSRLSPEGLATLKKLLDDLRDYLEESRREPAPSVLYQFLKRSGYLQRLLADGTDEADYKIQNIALFFSRVLDKYRLVAPYGSLPEFAQHLELLLEAGDDPATAEADSDTDAVRVLTIHKAKGLEFPVVFLVSLVDQRFPTRRKRDPLELPEALVKDVLPEGDFHLQEERRLFYVGLTRAQKELYLTSARDYGGARPKKVSQFVLETLDNPRADEDYFRKAASEVSERFAPVPDTGAPAKDAALSGERPNFSHRRIDDYLTCPLKYKYIHILNVPVAQHHSVIYGNAIHKAISRYNERKQRGEPVSLDELLEVFHREWRSTGFITREHEERRLEAGRQALRRFFEDQERLGIRPELVEEDFKFRLDEYVITGRWDRVDRRDGQVVIVDFKSSEVNDQQEADKKARANLQLGIYAIAYRELFGELPRLAELNFIETGIVGQCAVDDRLLNSTEEKIHKAATGILARNYEPTPGPIVCSYCVFSRVCPATQVGR